MQITVDRPMKREIDWCRIAKAMVGFIRIG